MTGCILSRAQARPLAAHVRVLVLIAVMLLTLLAPSMALALSPPSGLAVTSGAMADTLRWNRVRSSQTSAYRVERASVPSGPWKIVSRRTRATSLLTRVPSARTWYYRLRTIDRRGRVGAASAPVANSTVSISSVVGASGATLRASNGQMSLALPKGAFASATRVTVREAGGLDTESYVKVTRAYDFRATAALLAPASLTMRYKVPVTHFQVAAGLARSIDWMCWDAATGKWVAVPTAVDTAAGTFTAAMPHFSYWTAAVVDPHGMSKTQFCGDGNVCHALSPALGSPIVLSSSDSHVCYNCHGNSSAVPAAAGSNGHNIQAEFYACSGQASLPASGSAHPVRAPGSTSGLKCTSCHDPHADRAASPKLLRAYDAAGRAVTGSKGSPPPAATYCGACHGASRNRTVDAQFPGYWARSGGGRIDFSRFAGSVHESALVTTSAAYSCTACHQPHASGANPMLMPAGTIDWAQDVSSPQGLYRASCLGCHTGSSARTWNGRDIKVEFARASHHPAYAAVPTLTAAPEAVTVFAQGSPSEFSMSTMDKTTALDETGLSLTQGTWPFTMSAKRVILVRAGNRLDAFDPVAMAYNNPYDPADMTGDHSAEEGAVLGGSAYWADGFGAYELPRFDLDADTWITSSSDFAGAIDADPNHGLIYTIRTSGGGLVSVWDSSTGAPRATGIDLTLQGGGSFSLGWGSAIAYAPLADKLFFIYTDPYNGIGDAHLYYVDQPAHVSGPVVPVDTGIQMTIIDSTYSREFRMRVIEIGGVEYLVGAGRDGSGAGGLQVLWNLSATTPSSRTVPWAFTDRVAVGNMTMTSDGTHLYVGTGAILDVGGAHRWQRWARVAIPADPAADTWGPWTELPMYPPWNPYNFGTDMQPILAATVTPPPMDVDGYPMSGTAVSPEIVAPSDAVSWGAFDWGAIVPASTAVTTKVEAWNGSAWVVPTGMASITDRRVDLSGLAAATYRKIRVTALLATTDYTQTPWLTGWTVSVLRQGRPYVAGSADGGTACSSCHNVHALGAAGTTAWDLRRMSNPADTKRPMSSVAGGSVTSFCLTCHTGVPPRPGLPLGSVPATQAWGRAADRPLLTSMAKDEAGAAYSQSGHGTSAAGAIGCETCHDPHGSNNAELAAWTRPSWFTTGTPGTRDNTTTAAHEENLCYQCHGNGTVGLQGPGAQDVASPASRAEGHPVATDGLHSNSESLAALGSANRHSECTDCHDPHAAQPGVHTPGLSKAGPALRGAVGVRPTWSSAVFSSATSYERVRFTGGPDELEAYLCFKCHTSATTQTSTNVVGGPGGTDLSKEFNPANQSFHNALGRATGVREYFDIGGTVYSWGWVGDSSLKNGLTHDSKLTCTDCHTSTVAGEARGPHGSSTPFMLDPAYDSGYETARLDHDYPGGVYPSNLICTKCHNFSLREGEPGYNKVHGAANIYTVGHQGIPCIGCHVRVPHGSPRPRLLAYSTDPAPYTGVGWGDGYNPGTSGIRLQNYGPSSWVISDCEVGCSSTHENSPSSAPYWP